ncbi:MAG TPA: DoxX family protein [Pyrinomonadaceae bacterium]|nr:DoxX family protein [Chloracidobacterium sp.]MBP9934962.1 DoxX family protein [Pyrinomonadaceae bacterium]MBK7801410.1 DoxX family protein [Chloracidobacterium sp.]MBK9436730.1 DoxX family protein [Chloracidobacterium sp.]MBK9766359.1 DoxX family protein [Chloracidobacterium sp.]
MNTLLWVIQIILSLLFMFAGVSKFLTPAEEMAQNMPAFLSIGFIYFIGACEIIGSLGLILPWALKIRPRLTPLAATLLFIIMIGAVIVSAIGSPAMAIFPAITALLCGFVAWGRKK